MESVGKQLAESYEEISLLYTIIRSMTVVEQPERFVAIACEELLATLPYAWIGVDLAEDRQRLKKLAGRFVFAGDTNQPEAKIKALADRLLAQAKVDAPIVLEPATNPQHADYACFGQSALVHPISSDGKVIGLAIAGDKQGEDIKASSVDMKLLGATASHTAIFLENAALYNDLNAMFLGTLEALTASIDAKDRYTCGHSQRVAHLTQQLARAVGLDEHTISRTRIAGLVHDVGKIGVPERVLLKPGKLTDEEFEWIRRHPEMGYRILKDIPQLEDILPGVLYHHERYDGRGYPAGLTGEDIPFLARLITLADSFDAMSSNRTYRTRLSREEVLAEVERCAGTQFDPQLAPIFVKLDFSEFDRLVTEHQAMEESDTAPGMQEPAA
jgi:HD-GYP domain-containing protein (c-di-GMP phosphodiesterase class II)